MSNDFDEDAAFKELESIEATELVDNESLRQLLTDVSKRYKEYKVGDSTIRIKAAISGGLKTKILEFHAKTQRLQRLALDAPVRKKNESQEHYLARVDAYTASVGELAKEIDTETYSTLAALCLDYPFNTPDAWVIVEEETGLAANLLMEILRDILDTEKQIIEFR